MVIQQAKITQPTIRKVIIATTNAKGPSLPRLGDFEHRRREMNPRDGKSFHALRRTTGTRLIESGAGLPLASQILGHARINSSGRYYALASEQLRQCCLPLDGFPCTREGLR